MENCPGDEGRGSGAFGRSADRQFRGRVLRFLYWLTRLRKFARVRWRVPVDKLRAQCGSGGEAKRLDGARLLAYRRPGSFALGESGGSWASSRGTRLAPPESAQGPDAESSGD